MSAVGDDRGPHLSIGEVLALLLEEFPDVTISKIRFLESQGLIDPERTPSGYRKFYDEDVELLRCILHEQRENYLPLKVIKDRLDTGEIDPTNETTRPRGIRNVTFDATGEVGHIEVGDLGEAVSAAPPAPPTSGDAGQRHPSAGRPVTASGQDVAASGQDVAASGQDVAASGQDVAASGQDVAASATAVDPGHSLATSLPPSPTPASTSTAAPPPAPPPGGEPPPAAQPAAGGEPAAATGTDAATFFAAHPSDAAMDAGELAEAAGLAIEQIEQLASYGVIHGKGSRNVTYDGDALAICQIAVPLLEAGIEPRHLRGWRVAVDREVALFEQLVQPLVRQRNPTSRQHAVERLIELEAAGGQLRHAMMRAALRSLEDGAR